MIDEFGDRLHSFATDLQPIIAVSPTRLRKAASHPVSESAVLVAAFPQLAALMTQVTTLAN